MMIALDKQAHFWAGAAIAACVICWAGPWWALGAVTFAGALKEVWDSTGRGQVEAADLLWTVAGGGSVIGIWAVTGAAVCGIQC